MATKTVLKSELVATLKAASDVFKVCSRKTKILAALAWKPEVATEFFQKKETLPPVPTYSIDKKTYQDLLQMLKDFEPKLVGDHPILAWLRKTHESFTLGIRLLLELESKVFFEISTQLYGNAHTAPFKTQTTNYEMAQAISSRMSVCNLNDIGESLVYEDAQQFSASLEKKLAGRIPVIPVRVDITDAITAKVVAGMNRVRVRKDARFAELELSALWNHEIESHCLTAHNGARQGNCDFLSAGGPRTTMTQEGLAVFYEVYGHTMSQHRFLALCHRVEAISLVQKGADFMQIYRWYKERSDNAMEAFYNTQRIFRGADLKGGNPFTKDVVYLAGLLGVFNFLKIAVKNQNRLLVESLVCGRISLEDVGIIAWLRAHGLMEPPHFIPDWLKNWEALLSFFSLTAVFESVNLTGFQDYFDGNKAFEEWDLSI
jgi:uncharacterized protein (TIGR02421 family)